MQNMNPAFQMAAHLNCFNPNIEGTGAVFVSNLQDLPTPVLLKEANVEETFFRFAEGCGKWPPDEYLALGWRRLDPSHALIWPLNPSMKTLAVFKNDERRAAVMVGADERRSSWCLDVIVRPRRDEEGENSFRHSMTILEGGVRLIPEYQVYLSGKRYAPSFLKNAKFALGLDPQLDIDRNEIMERLRHSPIADYPWSFRWTFPESPREGMVLGIAHNPLHRKWEPLPPFLQSLLDYVWRLFQIQRL